MPTPQIRNLEGIVLRASKGGEGGRSLSLFTREMGLIHLTLPRAVMNRCGTGILLSFACVRLSAAIYPEYGVISQYEGRLLFDMMKLSYEDMTCWYYVIELVLALYPVGQKEDEAYDILMAAARAAEERNPRVIAFIASSDAASPCFPHCFTSFTLPFIIIRTMPESSWSIFLRGTRL